MRGLAIFREDLKRNAPKTLLRLFCDYMTYVGMVSFCLGLWLVRRPVAFLEEKSGRPVRETLLSWIGRVAKA
ncbi:MAG: hypothetical protein V1798_05715 [Pseudomonadota bacterium]